VIIFVFVFFTCILFPALVFFVYFIGLIQQFSPHLHVWFNKFFIVVNIIDYCVGDASLSKAESLRVMHMWLCRWSCVIPGQHI